MKFRLRSLGMVVGRPCGLNADRVTGFTRHRPEILRSRPAFRRVMPFVGHPLSELSRGSRRHFLTLGSFTPTVKLSKSFSQVSSWVPPWFAVCLSPPSPAAC